MFQNSPLSGPQSPAAPKFGGSHSPGFISVAAPYRMHVSQRYLDLTRQKLQATRLPRDPQSANPSVSPSWNVGVPKAELESILDDWVESYNWRSRETIYNDALPQFRASVNGARLHFVHKTSLSPQAIPLLCVQAWPESFIGVTHMIDDLTNPVASLLRGEGNVPAFHVVAPSIPGCGFSDQIAEEGNNIVTTAELFDALMKSLGYTHYIAHGVGWGFKVCRAISLAHAESCLAIHTANPAIPAPSLNSYPYHPTPSASPHSGLSLYSNDGRVIQDEHPPAQTLAYSLSDSPSGLLAYVMSLIQAQGPRIANAAAGYESGASSPAHSITTSRTLNRSPLADHSPSRIESWDTTAYIDWTMLHWLPGAEVALRWIANSTPMLPSLWATFSPVPLAITFFDELRPHTTSLPYSSSSSYPSSPSVTATSSANAAATASASNNVQIAEAYHRIAFARRAPYAPPMISRFPAWERPNEMLRDIRQLAVIIAPASSPATATAPSVLPSSTRS